MGTVYASVKYQDKIYLGTNQGLFYRNISDKGRFNFISGTKGQVWTLYEYDNQLFCGHDLGTFVINGNNARLIYSESGTWEFNTHPNHKNILIQGNYNGLSVLEKNNGEWYFKNKIKGFDEQDIQDKQRKADAEKLLKEIENE